LAKVTQAWRFSITKKTTWSIDMNISKETLIINTVGCLIWAICSIWFWIGMTA
jgi:hypothetical protein